MPLAIFLLLSLWSYRLITFFLMWSYRLITFLILPMCALMKLTYLLSDGFSICWKSCIFCSLGCSCFIVHGAVGFLYPEMADSWRSWNSASDTCWSWGMLTLYYDLYSLCEILYWSSSQMYLKSGPVREVTITFLFCRFLQISCQAPWSMLRDHL